MNPNIEILSSERKCSLCMRCCIGCAGIFTCGVFGGDKAVRGDYANFSLLMANYLNGNGILDLTASDIHVGLHMLGIVRRRKKLKITNRLASEHTRISKQHLSHLSEQIGSSETRINSNRNRTDKIELVPEVSSGGKSIEFVQKYNSTGYDGDSLAFSLDKEISNDTTEPFKQNEYARSLHRFTTSSNDTNGDIRENRLDPQNLREEEQKMEMLSRLNPKEVDLINEAAHFMLFAQAAYTVAAYMLERPLTGIYTFLFRILRNWGCFSPHKDSIEGDNLWHSHTIALKAISRLKDEDIIYANYSDTITAIPYMILLDHEWKSVVVTIRGTITLESVLTDINVAPEELTRLGEECGFDGEGFYCHTGMLSSTEWLYRDMKKHGKLYKVMAEYEGYKLRIIGHSLGAGVASILSILLRPTYPNLRCLAFSPPGCVMSENLANETTNFTTSYVVNDDIIARMNIEGFEELRDSVLEMICRIKIPKYKVTKVSKKFDDSSVEGLTMAIDEILYKKEDMKDSQFKQEVEKFLEFQGELKERHKENYIKLCPPGSIIQLFRTAECVNKFGEEMDLHTARWANRSDFEHIHIVSNLLTDHETGGVKNNIQKCARESFGLSPPFSPRPGLAEP